MLSTQVFGRCGRHGGEWLMVVGVEDVGLG